MIVTGTISQLHARAIQRGHAPADVEGCILSQEGETVTVETDHPAYPRAKMVGKPPLAGRPMPGVPMPGMPSQGWMPPPEPIPADFSPADHAADSHGTPGCGCA